MYSSLCSYLHVILIVCITTDCLCLACSHYNWIAENVSQIYYLIILFVIQDGTTPLLRACKHKQSDAAMDLIHANANLNEVDEVIWSNTFMAYLGYLQKCITTVNNVLGQVNKIYIAASRVTRARVWQMKALSRIQNSTSVFKIDLCHVIQAKVWLLAGLHFTITYSDVLNMYFIFSFSLK